MANIVTLWGYCSGFLYVLVVLSWEFIRRKLGPKLNQREYSILIIVISVVLPPLVMILWIILVLTTNPSDLNQIISDSLFYGGILMVYILISAIVGWQYSKLYPVNESKTLED
ncbi:MAG: hypothetical protein ACFFE6_09870 [Candidatus Thorarchaeota archaeon]